MNQPTLTKEEWVEQAYLELVRRTGAPKNKNEERNMRAWAEAMAEGAECNYFANGETPADAVDEEIQAAL